MSTLSSSIRVVKNKRSVTAGWGIALFMVMAILGSNLQAQQVIQTSLQMQPMDTSVEQLSVSAVSAVPVEKQTKIFQIKYTSVGDMQNMVQTLLSPTGKLTKDDRTNLLIVVDTPATIKKIEDLIASVDIPLETAIIPIKFADVQDVARELLSTNPRLKINVDTRTSNLLVTDIPSKIAQVTTLVAQMESSYINKPQTGLDCSVLKVTLDSKHNTGIDWSKCPFIGKSDSSSAILLENLDHEKLLEWLKNFGNAELLSRKRVTITPNEETQVREGFRYQGTEKPSMSVDTLGGTVYKAIPKSDDFGFTYRFLAKPMDTQSGKSALIVSFSVDGVLPQSGSTAAYGISVNNAQIPDGMTLVTEDVRGIPVVQESEPNKFQYSNVDLILLITPHNLKSEPSDSSLAGK